MSNMTPENCAYKWRKIFASKRDGTPFVKLDPVEAQELIDDIESISSHKPGYIPDDAEEDISL